MTIQECVEEYKINRHNFTQDTQSVTKSQRKVTMTDESSNDQNSKIKYDENSTNCVSK